MSKKDVSALFAGLTPADEKTQIENAKKEIRDIFNFGIKQGYSAQQIESVCLQNKSSNTTDNAIRKAFNELQRVYNDKCEKLKDARVKRHEQTAGKPKAKKEKVKRIEKIETN